MDGLIEYSYGKNGKQPIYPDRHVVLPFETEQLGKKNKNRCVTILILATLAFYSFGIYTYTGDLEYHGHKREKNGKRDCPSEIFIFMIPGISFCVALASISYTYNRCFVTQVVSCERVKHNNAYFQAIPFYLPMLFTVFTTCYVVPNTFKLATFGLCTVMATLFIGSRNYLRKHCQCKKCLGIMDVLLQNETRSKAVNEQTEFNQAELKNWFHIEMSRNAQLAIQLEDGEIIHTFTKDSPKIQLKAGRYHIGVLEMGHFTAYPATRACEPAPSPSDHLIPEKCEPARQDKTIMNID